MSVGLNSKTFGPGEIRVVKMRSESRLKNQAALSSFSPRGGPEPGERPARGPAFPDR